MPWYTCRNQSTTYKGWSSPSTMLVPGSLYLLSPLSLYLKTKTKKKKTKQQQQKKNHQLFLKY